MDSPQPEKTWKGGELGVLRGASKKIYAGVDIDLDCNSFANALNPKP